MEAGIKAGYRAFEVPLLPFTGRNQGQASTKLVRARMDALPTAAPGEHRFCTARHGHPDGGRRRECCRLARTLSSALVRRTVPVTNLRTIRKIAEENVTPLGFGRDIRQASPFQNLLREGFVDILRPDLQLWHLAHSSGLRHWPRRIT